MGTNDIMRDLYYANDGSEEDLTNWIRLGVVQTTYDLSQGLYYFNKVGGYYQTILRNIPNDEWEMTIVMGTSSLDQKTNGMFWVKLNDGYYYIIGLQNIFSASSFYYSYRKSLTRPSTTYSALSSTGVIGSTSDVSNAVALRFKTNGQIDIVRKDSHSTAAIARADNPTLEDVHDTLVGVIGTDVMSWGGAKIEEIGFISGEDVGESASNRFYGMYIDADLPTPEGGTANLINLISIDTITSIGGGAGGEIICGWKNVDDLAILKSNLGKSISIQDTNYGNYLFKGEITQMAVRNHDVLYRVEEGIRKLTKQFANTNPVLKHSAVLKVHDSELYDEFADWPVNFYANKILVTKDDNKYIWTDFPHTITDWTADPDDHANWVNDTPDNVGGDADYLYFYDPSHVNDVYGMHYINEIGDRHDQPGMEFLFKTWMKEDTVADDITAKIIVRFTTFKDTKVNGSRLVNGDYYYPKLSIYNYTLATWIDFYDFTFDEFGDDNPEEAQDWHTTSIEAADDSSGKTPIINTELDLLSLLNDIITTTPATFKTNFMLSSGSPNASGFEPYSIKLRLRGCAVPNAAYEAKMEVHYLHLQFDETGSTKISQGQELSNGLIISNTASKLNLSDVQAWSIANYPPADGVTRNDLYYITDDIETVLSDVFINANTNFTLETDFGNSYAGFGEIENLTYTYIYQYLQKISSTFNWAFWFVPGGVTDIVKVADQFDSTGLTFTEDDIINYTAGHQIVYDTYVQADKIVVIGDEGVTIIKEDGVDYNIEYANTLGDSEVKYENNELYTKRNVDQYATSKQSVNGNAGISTDVLLDYDNPTQNYSTIYVGKTVLMETGKFSSVDDGNLFIETLRYTKTKAMNGWQQMVNLHLMRRVV